jgi:ABC-type sugar transport system substrate-binding protein
MNKKFSLIMAVILIASLLLTACGGATEEPVAQEPAAVEEAAPAEEVSTEEGAAAAEKPVLAISLPSLDNPHFVAIQDGLTAEFSDEFEVLVSSAENDPITQAEQVQNYTAMGAKMMFVLPLEASSLIPYMIEFREAGGMIFVVGGNPGNPDSYDAVVDLNEFLIGLYMAKMAKNWVEATYPDAADGSVEAVILERTDTPINVTRTGSIRQISEPYLKNEDGDYVDLAGTVVDEANKVENPVYCSKVNVVGSTDVPDYETALNATQNFLVTNPDLKLVIGFDSDAAMGASQAMVDEFGKGPSVSVIDDLSMVATFGAGNFGAEGQAIADSVSNDTVFRGTLRWGGKGLMGDIEVMRGLLAGTQEKNSWQDIWIITLVDGELVSISMPKDAYGGPLGDPEPFILE